MATTASLNGKPPTCETPGCGARVHGRGLCRIHYDRARYLQATRQSPETVEEAQREQSIHAELSLGCVAEWLSPHRTNSMFASDEERREAWEARRDELMAHYLQPPYVGLRPWAWWKFEAGREQHLIDLEDVLRFEGPEDEEAALLDEYETEPVIWLAEHGHLTDRELEKIEERANEARPRVGTDAERIGSCGVDGRAYHGHDGLRRFVAEIAGEWEQVRFEVDEIRGAGEQVVALGRVRARGGASGVERVVPLALVGVVRDERVVYSRCAAMGSPSSLHKRGVRRWSTSS